MQKTSSLTHVLAFHRVASAGSFTVAASLGGLSQPTLSAQVRSLERTIGRPLFERSGRRIRLTETGERLHEVTRRLAATLEEVEGVIRGAREEVRGSLRVAADSAIHVLPVLAELKRQARSLRFSIRICNSAEVVSEVLKESVDVGVTARETRDPRLLSVRIRDDRLVVMVAAGDALATRRRLSLADLAGRDIVVRESGSITREVADRALKRGGIAKGHVFEVATREAVREAVAAGFGYGVVFASEAGPDARVAAIEIVDADVAVSEFAICRAERRGVGLIGRFLETAGRLAAESGWLTAPRGRR